MKDGNIVILHVFIDGMNVSNMANNYDSLPNVENLYYFYAPQEKFKLTKINDHRVKIIHDINEYVGYFSDPKVDVIVFYSLPYQYYYLFDYIDDSKYVVWWAWGYDIYNGQGNYPPLLPMGELYKPLTKEFMTNGVNSYKEVLSKRMIRMFRRCAHLPVGAYYRIRRLLSRKSILIEPRKSQEEILARIDACYAPLDIECELLKDAHPSFKAVLFPRPLRNVEFPYKYQNNAGNVLVNHSLTYTVNHLDVFCALSNVDLEKNRNYILPVSYGIYGYRGNPDILKSISGLNPDQTIWLTQLLPFDEYQKLMNSVTHAVFGMLRQQGLGNVFLCLRTGVKVFLYKDSMVYKELKKMGYVCFTIDDDLTTESLSTCLDEKDAQNNYRIYMERWRKNDPKRCRAFLEDVLDKKKEK